MKSIVNAGLFFLCSTAVFACASSEENAINKINEMSAEELNEAKEGLDTATLGAGCFWCVEAVFQELKGVKHVESGYTGGMIKNPSYKEVCTGRTGHAEVAQIIYDPEVVSFDEILQVFFKTHDPTTLNRQGNDIGTQYRSSIFYHNQWQKEQAEYYLKKLDQSGAYPNPIVTTIEPLEAYYPAEDYHQNYFNNNSSQPYCTFVIQPKLEKFREAFKDKLKEAP